MKLPPFINVAEDLELAGLIWRPEIGDEISNRHEPGAVSVLVDPQGMTPTELRSVYLWLPTVEQMVLQFEVRQAILFHAGVELTDVQADTRRVLVEVKPTTFSKYRIQFIGKGGRVLLESPETKAEYVFKGDEGYVRARVLESNGRVAWVQPVMIPAR